MTASLRPARKEHAGSWSIYFKPRVAVMLLLGFSSGLPLYLTGTGSLMQAWLTERDVSLIDIGLFGLVALAYGWKFLWAPVIDGFPIPLLSRLLGHRRAWLLCIQILLVIAIVVMGRIDPATDKFALAGMAVLVAFLAASQDIVIDAFRIESLPENELAAGTANYTAAYRVALLVSFTGAIGFITWCEASGMSEPDAWAAGYTLMAGLLGFGIVGTLLARENWVEEKSRFQLAAEKRIKTAILEPFRDFLKKDLWWVILLFVVLFKLGDAFTTELRTTFYLKMGFEKAAYAAIQWPVAFFPLLIGGFVGGYLADRLGMMRALWFAGIIQMATNIMFVWPALVLPDLTAAIGVADATGVRHLTFGALQAGGAEGLSAAAALAVPIALEQFATGVGGVVFIAFLSRLCGARAYTATQYALLSSFAAQARVSLAGPSGFVAEYWGWPIYYVLATLLALPGLALLWWLWRREERSGVRTGS